MRFCNNCQNLLILQTTDIKIYFICSYCKNETDATDEDTLLSYSSIHSNEILNQKNAILTAADDPVNMRTEEDCPHCKKKTIHAHTRLNNNLKLILSCVECRNARLPEDKK